MTPRRRDVGWIPRAGDRAAARRSPTLPSAAGIRLIASRRGQDRLRRLVIAAGARHEAHRAEQRRSAVRAERECAFLGQREHADHRPRASGPTRVQCRAASTSSNIARAQRQRALARGALQDRSSATNASGSFGQRTTSDRHQRVQHVTGGDAARFFDAPRQLSAPERQARRCRRCLVQTEQRQRPVHAASLREEQQQHGPGERGARAGR